MKLKTCKFIRIIESSDYKLTPLEVDLEDAIYSCRESEINMSFVPSVIKYMFLNPEGRLAGNYNLLDKIKIHQGMFNLARAGIIELRPESGMNRLSQDELNLCPESNFISGKVYLSWIRSIQE